ncbi:hypothetical protein EI77_03249 [Prosthecobacter fusiformis]|uniref:Uncharacterized protein n=1 Tax=Prosthecobacter fusiformis TaxID=48464 RepID=A0A4R7RRC0_9BACT|nr:hypothetical protein [Prosthecobacter fusiformis]TDU68132.1 hypothetical protein EI77_03249 [Prosthecobacter fusiformis]
MTPLQSIPAQYRTAAQSQKEKGSYFEELICTYFRYEASYAEFFLVPSLNLLSQSLIEWTQESGIPLHSFPVCSDAEVGKKRDKNNANFVETFDHELRYPSTTDAKRLAYEVTKRHDAQHMSVIFSTYHSLDVFSRALTKNKEDWFESWARSKNESRLLLRPLQMILKTLTQQASSMLVTA